MELKKVDNHIPRLVEKKLEKYINGIGGVLIEGPKSCGKTHLGQRYTKSQFRLQDYSEDQIDNFEAYEFKGKHFFLLKHMF